MSYPRFLLLVSLFVGGFNHVAAQTTLRSVAQQKGVYVGNLISIGHLQDPAGFRGGLADATLLREFDAVVLENNMKMGFVLPTSQPANVHDLTVDQLAATLQTNRISTFLNRAEWDGLRKRGHAFIWYSQAPGWLNGSAPSWTGQQVFDFSRKYIFALSQICGDEIDEWDVINEAISDNTSGGQRIWRENTWYRNANDGSDTDWGPATYENYVKWLFVWAREAQPHARLYYNDYSIEFFDTSVSSKNRFMREKMRDLRDCGAPIDAIGFQSHLTLNDMVSTTGVVNAGYIGAIRSSIQALAADGFEVAITELDIRICNNGRPEAFQEAAYREFAEMALSQPNCHELLVWGLRDEDHWITVSNDPPFAGCQDAVLFEGADYVAKPAYAGLLAALNNLDDADGYGFAELVAGNATVTDCGGTADNGPAILAVNGPQVVAPEDEITVNVDYRATAEQEITVVFQLDGNPFTVYAAVTRQVSVGQGTLAVGLTVPASTPLGQAAYQYQVFIAPPGGGYDDRLSNLAQTDVTVSAEGVGDAIVAIEAPGSVRQGETVTVNVNYAASQDREIVIYFQLDDSPYTVFTDARQLVTVGEGTATLELTIPESTPVADNDYQFQVLLAPPGGNWPERLSNIERRDVSVTTGNSSVSGAGGPALLARAYPNPTAGFVTLAGLDPTQPTTYEVYATTGRRMLGGRVTTRQPTVGLDLSALPAGLYTVALRQGHKRGVVRVLRQD